MSSAAEPAGPAGPLEVALRHARHLLRKDPQLAAEQAMEILNVVPGEPEARLVLGAARRLAGNTEEALTLLAELGREQPRSAAVQLEWGMAAGQAGRTGDAVAAFRRALTLAPDSPDGWRLLADQLDLLGDAAAAELARARYLGAATRDPQLLDAGAALVANDLPLADARLRSHLSSHPTDVAALRMLAEVAARLRRYEDAQTLLERCLELAPSFAAARHNYAVVLNRLSRPADALQEVRRLLAGDPRNPGFRNLHAAILAQLGDCGGAIAAYRSVLADHPHQPKIWLSYGHALKTDGRHQDCVAAYRRAIALEPTLGEAYWSLANLKTFRFSADDAAAMRDALGRADLATEDRLHFEFSLGKALEDDGAYGESFAQYAAGNARRRAMHPYSADDNAAFVATSKSLYTAEFFAARRGAGAPARDPIFIVGLPRAGSTLLEQILASHSMVEGTMELPLIPRIARELVGGKRRYVDAVAALSAADCREFGERYLAEARAHRRLGRPFFVDKMPNNCLYVGLIHLMLPNAVIIDARRHPLGCCLSGFKQHFARGQNFAYRLEDIGRYYRDYVDLMAHLDGVLPGRIHRVFYETLIEDTESEVRRLLAGCGLDFEAGCLRFHENQRAVRTASSEQVRRPLFRDGMDRWRYFEPWLGPLKTALGPVLRLYPEVPGIAPGAPA